MREGMEKQFGNDHEVWKHFDAYKMKFSTAFSNQKPGLKKLDSPGLYQNFNRILHDAKPKRHYVNSDWSTRGFFGFLKIIPVGWSDKLRTLMMRLPL